MIQIDTANLCGIIYILIPYGNEPRGFKAGIWTMGHTIKLRWCENEI